MATKLEREVIELSAQLKTILSIFESQRLKVDKTYKTVFENGLSSRVEEMHKWMSELRAERADEKIAEAKLDGDQKLLGMKINGEARTGIIVGVLAIVGQIVLRFIP